MKEVVIVVYFVTAVIASVWGFVKGWQVIVDEPVQILLGLIAVVAVHFLLQLSKILKDSGTIRKGSLMWKVKKNKAAMVMVIGVLWALAIGNFVFSFHASRIESKLAFFDAVMLILVVHVLVFDKKRVQVRLL